MPSPRPRVLVSLPEGYSEDPLLGPEFARLWESAEPGTEADSDVYLGALEPRLLDPRLDQMPRLRLAALLDCSADAARVALRRGLPVSLARDAHAPFSAELALRLLLEHFQSTGPRLLSRKLIGLIGFGPVARQLRHFLEPLLVPISVYDPFVSDEVLTAHRVVRLDLPELCQRNDAVLLTDAGIGMAHAPTLLNAPELSLLKPGTLLLCLSRPELIDPQALLARLTQDNLSVVFVARSPLPPHERIRLLPPIDSPDVRRAALRQLVSDIEAFLAGRPRSHALHEGMINLLPL